MIDSICTVPRPKSFESLSNQVKKSAQKILKDYGSTGEKNFNFFYATGCDRYEIRHAAFFAWMFNPEKYSLAKHFVASLLCELDKEGVALHNTIRKCFEGGLGKIPVEFNISKIPDAKGYTEIPFTARSTRNKGRIDFAADIRVDRTTLRLVIEFKNEGVISNNLVAYRKFVQKGLQKGDPLCLVVDFSGKNHELESGDFQQIPTEVLVTAVENHLNLLGKRVWNSHPRERMAIENYLEVLKAAEGEILDKVLDSKGGSETLWNFWNPQMNLAADNLENEINDYLGQLMEGFDEGEQEDKLTSAIYSFNWQMLLFRRHEKWFDQELRPGRNNRREVRASGAAGA
ncbi:MAG: hypothetical protein GXY61_08060 [Lentisphaerae bacterium]|nr:hypothetical protein [Lentisphaerota bacterium]